MPKKIDPKWIDGAILGYLWTHDTAQAKDLLEIKGMCCQRTLSGRLHRLRDTHMIIAVMKPAMGVWRHSYRTTNKGKTSDEAHDLVAYWQVKAIASAMENSTKKDVAGCEL